MSILQLRDRPAPWCWAFPGGDARGDSRGLPEKAKRYHPDTGGEDWTFRMLAQAYEMLSTAGGPGRPGPTHGRAAAAGAAGAGAGAGSAAAARPRPERKIGIGARRGSSTTMPRGRGSSAAELLCIRYLWDDADYLWLTQRVPGRRAVSELQPEHQLARRATPLRGSSHTMSRRRSWQPCKRSSIT